MNKKLTDTISILNTVRNNASDSYRDAIPLAKVDNKGVSNIKAIGDVILSYEPFMNEFVPVLINRIAFTLITNKIAKNKLEILKKGKVPLGTDIQDIISNPASASPYDKNDFSDILREKEVDTKVCYYRRNRQDKYKVTLFFDGLKGAFVDENTFMNYISSIVNTLYSGNYIDEYGLTKGVLSEGFEAGYFVTYKIPDYSVESLKGVIKEVRADYENFQIPSSNYNKFAEVYEEKTGMTTTPVVTWCSPEDQIIIIESNFLSAMGVDVLASQFNLSEVEFRSQMVTVDNFDWLKRTGIIDVNGHKEYETEKTTSNLKMVHCDRGLFQIYDNLFKFTTDYNGGNLAWQYWLHVWQTYALRLWANCKMYYLDGEPTPPSPTEKTFTITGAEKLPELGVYVKAFDNNLNLTKTVETGVYIESDVTPTLTVTPIGIAEENLVSLSLDSNKQLILNFLTFTKFSKYMQYTHTGLTAIKIEAEGYKSEDLYMANNAPEVNVTWQELGTIPISDLQNGVEIGSIENFNYDAFDENSQFYTPAVSLNPAPDSPTVESDFSFVVDDSGTITMTGNAAAGDEVLIRVTSIYYDPSSYSNGITIEE